ncbi:hypothetical protein PPERSA_09391 [Pseudocohnilembus persalinus]|uniref:Bax inhibitor 1-related n=1 Tax=Pseudocohnilembus persalinus TaxID=266149 RepID=A0A0V0QL47_PSEPJ|nr:hypothetical protein PPERSA_09391 [Pseudocohnilembus persalinus]|eukprot:KRX02973.1 hypothetical protein PPERSA_09391 [Pseudocohnilembus persalinus]
MQNYNDPYAQQPQQPQYNQPQGFTQPQQQYNYPNQQQYNNNNANNNYNNNNQQDFEQQQNLLNKEQNLDEDTGLLGRSRMGFIRKVYLLLACQLSVVGIMTAISMTNYDFAYFQAQNIWLYVVFSILQFVLCIAIFCNPQLAIKTPTNYILCGLFTFCFAWIVSTICGFYWDQKEVVFAAALLTFVVTLALTIYAITTKTDFTGWVGFLWVLGFTFMFMMMFLFVWNYSVLNIMCCWLGVLLYGIYLIVDTQLIVGGKNRKFQLDYDHYILGAMMLFIDIIGMFLYILSLLSKR